MAENFQDNIAYGGSTLAVSGDAVKIGSTNAGAKYVIFNNTGAEGHLAWTPGANRTIVLPDAAGTVMLTSQAILSISAGATRATSGEVVFSNSNGVGFGINGNTLTASYTVPTVPAQLSVGLSTGGNTVGDTGVFTGRVVFAGGNNVTLSGASNAGSVTVTISAGAQTAQTQSLIAGIYDGANSISTGTIRFTNANGVSFSINGQTISGSVAAQSVQTQSLIAGVYDGANSISTGTIRFTNANGVSFSINGQTISGSVAAQSNQQMTLFATGNTTQSSTGTTNASSIIFRGAGIASIGVTGGSVVISVPAGAPSPVNFSAGATSSDLGSVVFSNSNGVSFGLNGSTITASVAAAAGAQSLYALGNTTQNSSTTLSSLSFNAIGAMTWGYSNGSIQVSAPPQSSISATGLVSISVNGSTISIGAAERTFSAWNPYGTFMTGSGLSSNEPASIWFNRFVLDNAVAVSNVNLFKSMNAAPGSATSVNSSGSQLYSYSHGITLYKRQDFGANSTNLTSFTTASVGLSGTYTFSSGTQASIIIKVVTNTTGGTSSFTTTSAGQGWSNFLTGGKLFQIPMLTTLSAGEYFVAHQHSSTTARTGSNFTFLSFSNMIMNGQISATGIRFGHISSSGGTFVSSHMDGIGFGVASANTVTTTMAASVISMNASAQHILMNFSNA